MKNAGVPVLIFLSAFIAEASPYNLEFSEMIRTRGQYYDLAVSSETSGDRLYVAAKLGVEIYSLQDPAHPVLEGWFPTAGLANGVAVNYPFVYVGDVYGFSIWDVSDIGNPVIRSSLRSDQAFGYQERLYYRDGLVYIAAYSKGLQVVDVRDPDHPVLAGQAKGDAYAWDLALTDEAVYIMDFFSMAIMDIRRPGFPVKRKTMNTMFAHGAAVRDDYLFLGYVDGLRIMDISDPFNPVDISDMGPTGDGTAQSVSLSGDYAFVGHGNYIEVYDISTIHKPLQIAYFYPPGNPRKLVAHNGYLYTVLDDSGFLVTNISDPYAPVQEVHMNTGVAGTRLDAVYHDQTLYLVDWSRGLVIYDTSQPGNLVELCTFPVPGSVRECVIQDQTAYLVGQGEILIVDVSDREHPVLLGDYQTSGRPYTISVDTDLQRIYLCDLYGFFILDISNPADIRRIGAIWLAKEGNPYAARVIGSHAFIANGWKGMKVVDISDPAHPELVLTWPGDNSKSYVSVSEKNGLLYFMNPSRGIDVLNVSNPLEPALVVTIPFDNISVNKFILEDDILFLAGGINGVFIYSIANPAVPALVGYVNTPGETLGVGFSDDRLFVADRYNLSVYLRKEFVPDTRVPVVTILDPEPLTQLGNKTFIVSGTAYDGQSGVRNVQISMDSGETWDEVFGQETWSFVASGFEKGPVSVRARAFDWNGNVSDETPDVWCYFNPPSPEIWVAGFETSRAVAGERTDVILGALVRDPWDEVYVTVPEMFLDGEAVEYTVLDRVESPGYVYVRLTFEHVFQAGEFPGINLIIRDSFQNPSRKWPEIPSRW